MRFSRILIFLLITLVLNVYGSEIEFASESNLPWQDGPYIFIEDDYLEIYNIKSDTLEIIQTEKDRSNYYLDFLSKETLIDTSFQRDGTVYSSDKFVVLSDIHGQFKVFKELLVNNDIINEDYHWIWGDGLLIINGDIFDRGPEVTEILWLIYDLRLQADKAGGEVIVLIGNHELMIFQNDLRYIASKYQHLEQISGISYSNFLGGQTVLGRWLRSCPTAIKINNSLICHAGISPEISDKYEDWQEINLDFWNLVDEGFENNPKNILLGSYGPFWYRGYFKAVGESEQVDVEMFETILKKWDLKEMIVGHTTQDTISTQYAGKLFAIDAGMKRGLKGEALLYENGIFFKIDNLGKKEQF